MQEKIYINVSAFYEKFSYMPGDDAVAAWTFDIDGEIMTAYGRFDEACAKAKLYVRLCDAEVDTIGLLDRAPVARVLTRKSA